MSNTDEIAEHSSFSYTDSGDSISEGETKLGCGTSLNQSATCDMLTCDDVGPNPFRVEVEADRNPQVEQDQAYLAPEPVSADERD